jgi:hypothetical protein
VLARRDGLDGVGREVHGRSIAAWATASIASTMERVMIQADSALLERARRAARERGVTFPQLVREALEHELATQSGPPRLLACGGVISTGGRARERGYAPDPWR